MTQPLLQIENLTKIFGGLVAVDDVNISINEGEQVGLVGPNGAGKSTIFNLICGVHKCTEGKIMFKGREITNLRASDIARMGVGRLFQTNVIWKTMTVLESLITVGGARHGNGLIKGLINSSAYCRKEKMTQDEAEEMIEAWGLATYKQILVHSLPHGLQRKLGIAMALMMHPALLLLDEPTTGLNAAEIKEVEEGVSKFQAKEKVLILVEHNMQVVMEFCKRVIVLNEGRVIADGSPQYVSQKKEVIEAYLGTNEGV